MAIQDGAVPENDGSTEARLQAVGESVPPEELRERAEALERELTRRTAELSEANRELSLEAAVERVRAHAMGMNGTEDLPRVLFALFDEYMGMDLGVFRVGLTFIDETGRLEPWIAATDANGERTLHKGTFTKDDGEEGHKAFDAWRDQSWFCVLESPEFIALVRRIYGQTFDRVLETVKTPDQYLFGAMHRYGMLHAVAPTPVEEDSVAGRALRRFASAFELAYGRYLDIQRAEAAALEARIEAALERIRGQAMAMRESSDLLDIVVTMRSEFVAIGHEAHYFWHMRWMPDTYHKAMTSGDGTRIGMVMDLPRGFHNVPAMTAWEQNEEPIGVFQFDANGAIDYVHRMVEKGQFHEIDPNAPSDDDIRHIGGITFVMARTTHGEIGYSLPGVAEPPPDATAVLGRFAGAFDLAYRRFEDLKQAEAQAREARIETALERVRSRALAMQSSAELHDVAVELRAQMNALDQSEMEICAIRLYDAPDTFATWVAVREQPGSEETVSYQERLPRVGVPAIEESIALYESDRNEYSVVNEGAGAHAFMALLKEHAPDLYDKRYRPLEGVEELPTQRWYCCDFSGGSLLIVTVEPPDAESLDLLRRSANVFDLAYRRFRDLQQAEEDNRRIIEEKERAERALADLRATQKQLVEQEKLASLGALTAGIAHEIKNPLNFVNNFAEVNAELAEEAREALAVGDVDTARQALSDLEDNATQIAKHGKRADSIVRSMMQHARGGASEKETIVVNRFLEEYAGLAWHGMRARDDGFTAELDRDFAEEVGSVEVMPQELGRVILNLLNNAFDAVKGTDDARVTISSRGADGAIEITVSDNGPGIPAAIREKIFEPFFTTKPTGEGTGLGLSLSYDIVTKGHGGTMKAGESPGGGAEFRVTLPI